MGLAARYDELIEIPRAARFPIEFIPPHGFDPGRLETWPKVIGRLEYVGGRLLFMPPCGDLQQYTVTDVIITLGGWVRAHRDFVLGTNEAGMHLQKATRAADAAVWRRADVGSPRGKLQEVPPVLAVEVAGDDEDEPALREKAQWYFSAGVEVVWIVLPEAREVVVMTGAQEARCRCGETLPPHAALPNLQPRVDDLFVQISDQ